MRLAPLAALPPAGCPARDGLPCPLGRAVAPLDGRAPEEIGRLALPARAVLVRLGVALARDALAWALGRLAPPDGRTPEEIGRLALPARAVLVRLGVALARDELTCRLVLPDGRVEDALRVPEGRAA